MTDILERKVSIQTWKRKVDLHWIFLTRNRKFCYSTEHLNENPLSFEIIHDTTFETFQHSVSPICNPPSSDNIGGLKQLRNENPLKLVSAIFYQIFIFHQMISLQKLWKFFLFHLKCSFRSRDIQILVFLSSPLFSPVSNCFRSWSKKILKYMASSTV